MFISTYDDHRMAMAFAPLATLIPELEFEDADVVEKSYPAFWKDLEKAGFELRGKTGIREIARKPNQTVIARYEAISRTIVKLHKGIAQRDCFVPRNDDSAPKEY
jgi:hypothetical protein